MQFPNWIRTALQKTVSFSSPLWPSVGRIRYAPTTGYVRSFEIPMRSPDWVRARVQKMDLYTPSTVAYGGAYAIRPYNRVRAIFRNTDAIFQLNTCGSSKNCPVFIPFGAVCGAYTIRPYNQVRVALQNTDAIPQPGTYDSSKFRYNSPTRHVLPSKNCPVFVPFGAAGWGIFDTPLRPGTCDPSKYRCDSPTGYVRSFEIPM